ncbi:MAG: hypothetical protein QW400_02225 [Candidatus Diapherotrites archaeon]
MTAGCKGSPIEVNKSKKTAKINLSKAFYPKKVVNKALKEVKGAKLTNKESKNYFHITVKTEKRCAETFALEFCNFLLGIIKGAAP